MIFIYGKTNAARLLILGLAALVVSGAGAGVDLFSY